MSVSHISESLPSGMRERGDLPARIQTINPKYAGVVFAWSDERGVFVAEYDPDLVALPWIVRGLFGASFFAAPPNPIYIDNDGAVLEVMHAG